jgi:DNA-binding CsgD family transcriptional regulator
LKSNAARIARRRIVEACVAGHDQTTLLTTVSPLLAEVVPFDAAGWSACDPDTMLPTAFHTPNMPDEVCRAYFENELFAADVNKLADLVRRGRPSALLSEATRGELERSPRYRTMLAPYGHERELRVPFVVDGQCWGSACFVRDGSRPDFTAAEAGYVAQLARHLAQGLCGAVVRAAAQADRPAPGAPGMLVVDDACRVRHSTPEAERWLAELDPSWTGPEGDVPVIVRSAVARARAAAESGGGAVPPRVRVRTAAHGWIVVHAGRLSGPAPQWAVVLEPARPSEVLTLIAHAHGLTPREQEVFGMLLRGLTDPEMVEALVISPHTQREHVKRVLQKFAVRNRTELVLRVYAEQREG